MKKESVLWQIKNLNTIYQRMGEEERQKVVTHADMATYLYLLEQITNLIEERKVELQTD